MRASNNQRVQRLLTEMTLDEKLAQLGSCWMYELQTGGEIDPNKVAALFKDGIGQITRMTGASALPPQGAARAGNALQKYLVEQTRLGIPAILHEECCNGAMALGGTVFPQMLGLAASFEPTLARQMTVVIRRQLMAIGARLGLAPVLDIARDPRWGRVEETFGEDATLTSHFSCAYIQGLQGDRPEEGVLATGKHFIGHSFSQGGMNCAPVHIGWREIYDICLAPFQAAIKHAGLKVVMNSYPELDGEVVAASRRILTGILRDELGFEGLLVSDYEAVTMLHDFHFVAPGPKEAARMALEAGIDVELPTTKCYGSPLREAIEAGDISMETLDRAVCRHLETKFELGLFEQPYVDEGHVLEVFDTPGDRQLAGEIARKTIVLLKNNGILPLAKSTGTLAVIGPNAADSRSLLGDYAYASMSELLVHQGHLDQPLGESPHAVHVSTIVDSIRQAAAPSTRVIYAQGCDHMGSNRDGMVVALHAAHEADVVVLVLGDRSGLVPSCTTGETRDSSDLRLPGLQEDLARAVIGAGKPVVVVLVTGRPYAIPWLAEHAGAIIEAWLPGEEGAAAVTDVLFGDANPGGKLPITFPRSVGQLPIYHSSSLSGTRSYWYDDYVTEKSSPLYPFGHGLSYTTFNYDSLAIDRRTAGMGEHVQISFRLTNSGPVRGEEVVQLYTRDEFASVPRPVKELKGFMRVALDPQESKTITFHLPVDQLAFYNLDRRLILEPGRILIMIGSSSADIRLSGEFEIGGPALMFVPERVTFCPVDVSDQAL